MIVFELASIFKISYVEFQSWILMWIVFHSRVDEGGPPLCISDTTNSYGIQCLCKENFAGPFCDKCATGYYNFPDCTRK